MAIKKNKNKFQIPQTYDQSIMFANGGNIFWDGSQMQLLQAPQVGVSTTPGFDSSKLKFGDAKGAATPSGNKAKSTTGQFGVMQGLQVAQGAMQLGSQIGSNFDTSGIKAQQSNINDIGRNDLSNSTNVDSMQNNVAGQSLTGAMTGAKAGQAFGQIGTAVGAGIGLIGGGLSSIFGNKSKEEEAERVRLQNINNIQTKDRQFQMQDLKSDMANYNAMGGGLFAYGGNIQSNSPLTEFNSGQTHELNPNGGVMQGTGPNGQPNLVEEGETKHEDYIFSNRLKIDPKITKEFKLPSGLNGKTFADASKYLSREGKDRPNDPISNNAIKAELAKLTAAQEGLKQQMQSHQPQQQHDIQMQGQQQMQQNIVQAQQSQEQSQGNIMADGSEQFANGGNLSYPYFNPENTDLMHQNIYPPKFAMGGNLQDDQTHWSNTTHQGAYVYADGGQIDNFWGIKNGKYTQEFKDAVEKLYNDPVKSAQALAALKSTGYVKNKEDLLKYTNDYKLGPVHEYMKQNILQPEQVKPRLDYYGDWPDPEHNSYLRPVKLSEVRKARETDPNAYKGFEAGEPTGTTFALGGNIYDGNSTNTNYIFPMQNQDQPWSPIQSSNYIQQPGLSGRSDILSKNIDTYGANHIAQSKVNNPKTAQSVQSDLNTMDYSRYAPVAANMITGISDMFQKPEEVKYGRVNPEMNTSHMDYQPIDTEWMTNKMQGQFAGARNQMINQSGGNRNLAIAGLSGLAQQQQAILGDSYLKAQDINYGRKQQANQFNAGIEQQNIAAQNQAQQLNLQISMQEAEMNARNRAAKRNAARQAILNAASNIGDIGRENYFGNIITKSTGYNPLNNLKYSR